MTIVRCQYDCPKKYCEAFKTLLQEHVQAGRLRPSSSPFASPCFLVPKSDPSALPRWVNDCHILNKNTVPDVHLLPSIQEILLDCARSKIWGKLDMTNSFFQMRSHPNHVKYTTGLIMLPLPCNELTTLHDLPMTRHPSACTEACGSLCCIYCLP